MSRQKYTTRPSFLIALLTASALVATACSDSSDVTTIPASGETSSTTAADASVPLAGNIAPNSAVKIVAIQHALCAWDAFFCEVERGIADAAAALQVDVEVVGPDGFDPPATVALVDEAVASNPDAIMLTVIDPVLFADPINRAISAGIPVIVYNAGGGPDGDGIPYLTYVGQDDYATGYRAGQRLVAAGGTSGVCINFQVGSANLDARCEGFLEAFREEGLEAQVLGDPTGSVSPQAISDFHSANPNADAFLTLGSGGAPAFYAYLDESGAEVMHGTFDLSPEIVENIKSGATLFGIDQQPYLQGYGAVTALALLVRRNIVPAAPITPTGPIFLDADNVDEVAEGLAG